MSSQDFSQESNKPFWASQTVWSSIAAIGASLTGTVIAVQSGDVAGVGAALAGLLGAAGAIAGRYKARTTLAPPFG